MKYSTQNKHIMKLLGQAILKKKLLWDADAHKFSCEYMPAMSHEVEARNKISTNF